MGPQHKQLEVICIAGFLERFNGTTFLEIVNTKSFKCGIKGRFSTWFPFKKSYNITLQTKDSFLSMNMAEDYIKKEKNSKNIKEIIMKHRSKDKDFDITYS